jgi:dihydroneopterin aldolase/D-erythro-7,8-dihydroneopterin triphosphate epimerase
MDKILIKDLRLRCIIGINEFERREKQDVTINVVIWSDLADAAKTDDISKTVDYKEITKNIIKLVESSEFHLVETLAEKIAQSCLDKSRIRKVKVTIEKPGALRFARSVGVTLVRRRD